MKTSKYSADQDFQWAVKLNRYTLQSIGLWPTAKQTKWEKCMCNLRTFLTFWTIVIVILIPAVQSLIRIYTNIFLVIDNLQYTLVMIICMAKISFFWWKKTVVTPIIDMIANDWLKTKTPREKTVMIARARTARMIVLVAYAIMAVAIFVANAMCVFGHSIRYLANDSDSSRITLYETYDFYDVSKSPQYELTLTSQVFTLFLCALAYGGVDTFLSLSVFHICGQLDILKNRLIHINGKNYIDILKSVVTHHDQLLRAIAIIEDTYSTLFLTLFALFGVISICFGFLLTNIFEDGYNLTFSQLTYLTCILLSVFGPVCMYCALGEFLTAQCDQIHYAVYSNEWYIVDPRDARNLILLMVRSSKPLYLSVGNVCPLTMATFCNLLKTSAGYLSVLLTMQQN